MSKLKQPFFNGVTFTIMIGEVEVTLSPHRTFTNLAFECVDLSHLNLFSCSFDNCSFTDCNLVDVDWSGTAFSDCTFANCDMSSSVMYEAAVKDCTFTKCELTGMRTYICNFDNARFSSCKLDSMRVFETEFASSVIEHCTFGGAEWRNCVIACSTVRSLRAIDEPSRLSLVGITHTVLDGVEMHGAELNDCSFTSVKMVKCNFWKSTFQGPLFRDCTISHVGMNETIISVGLFFKSALFGCRLRLMDFDHCILEQSDIVACSLAGADLSRALLCESALIDDRYSEGGDHPTVLP